jgi:competence protein ComEC
MLWGVIIFSLIQGKRRWLIAFSLSLTMFVGVYRLSLIDPPVPVYGKTKISGVVRSVDVRLDKTIVTVRDKKSRAKIQVHTKVGSYLPGDMIVFEGNLQQPKPFLTDSGRVFDYEGYLKSRGVTGVMFDGVVSEQAGRDAGIWISLIRFATKVRFFIAGALSQSITFPVDGIISGMLVGYQGGIPEGVSDTFRNTGLLHMLVLSGYNITMLGAGVGILFKRAPLLIKNIAIASAILLLVLVSGAGVSAIRAGIMGGIGVLATSSRNKYDAFRALLLSFIFFFAVSPLSVLYDPGLHLSFLATFFLITVLPKIVRVFSWVSNVWNGGLREYIALTSGIALFMVPYLLYFSGVFPYVTPFANALIGPLVPFFMAGGLVVVLLSPVSVIAGAVGSLLSFAGAWLLKSMSLMERLPLYQHPPFSWWVLVVIYGSIILLFFWREIKTFISALR